MRRLSYLIVAMLLVLATTTSIFAQGGAARTFGAGRIQLDDGAGHFVYLSDNNGSLGIDANGLVSGTFPSQCAMLDISSTTKGFLAPRMTTAQELAICGGTPPEGLIVYNTTTHTLDVYNGTSWGPISGWTLAGNSLPTGGGTGAGQNFIGTLNATDFVVGTNVGVAGSGVGERIRVTSGGNVGISATGNPFTPSKLLNVDGTAATLNNNANPNVRFASDGGVPQASPALTATDGIMMGNNAGDLTKYNTAFVVGSVAWLRTGNNISDGNNLFGTLNDVPVNMIENNTTEVTLGTVAQGNNVGIKTAPLNTWSLTVGTAATNSLLTNGNARVNGTFQSYGNSDIGNTAGTTNTMGNAGASTNSIGNVGASTNKIGNGGGAFNTIGTVAAVNDIGDVATTNYFGYDAANNWYGFSNSGSNVINTFGGNINVGTITNNIGIQGGAGAVMTNISTSGPGTVAIGNTGAGGTVSIATSGTNALTLDVGNLANNLTLNNIAPGATTDAAFLDMTTVPNGNVRTRTIQSMIVGSQGVEVTYPNNSIADAHFASAATNVPFTSTRFVNLNGNQLNFTTNAGANTIMNLSGTNAATTTATITNAFGGTGLAVTGVAGTTTGVNVNMAASTGNSTGVAATVNSSGNSPIGATFTATNNGGIGFSQGGTFTSTNTGSGSSRGLTVTTNGQTVGAGGIDGIIVGVTNTGGTAAPTRGLAMNVSGSATSNTGADITASGAGSIGVNVHTATLSLQTDNNNTLGTNAGTTNFIGNVGASNNNIGNGAGATNYIGNGGGATVNHVGNGANTNTFGDGAVNNDFGNGATFNTIGSYPTSTNFINGTTTYINAFSASTVNMGILNGTNNILGATNINTTSFNLTTMGNSTSHQWFLLNGFADAAANTPAGSSLWDAQINGDLFVSGMLAANNIANPNFTQGSVIFAGANGLLSQNNPQFFWNNASAVLLLGTNVTNGVATRFQVTKDETPGVGGDAHQVIITGATTTTQMLELGYNTTGNNGTIQSINQGVGSTNLLIQPVGGTNNRTIVGSSSASTSTRLWVNGVIGDLAGGPNYTNGPDNGWDLYVQGDAQVTGILKLGTASIVADGNNGLITGFTNDLTIANGTANKNVNINAFSGTGAVNINNSNGLTTNIANAAAATTNVGNVAGAINTIGGTAATNDIGRSATSNFFGVNGVTNLYGNNTVAAATVTNQFGTSTSNANNINNDFGRSAILGSTINNNFGSTGVAATINNTIGSTTGTVTTTIAGSTASAITLNVGATTNNLVLDNINQDNTQLNVLALTGVNSGNVRTRTLGSLLTGTSGVEVTLVGTTLDAHLSPAAGLQIFASDRYHNFGGFTLHFNDGGTDFATFNSGASGINNGATNAGTTTIGNTTAGGNVSINTKAAGTVAVNGATNINTGTYALTTVGNGSINQQLKVVGNADLAAPGPPPANTSWDVAITGDLNATGIIQAGIGGASNWIALSPQVGNMKIVGNSAMDISTTAGLLSLTSGTGTVQINNNLTAVTNITATSGNIVASAGNITATAGKVTAGNGLVATAGGANIQDRVILNAGTPINVGASDGNAGDLFVSNGAGATDKWASPASLGLVNACGAATANTIAMFTGATTVCNSPLTVSGLNVTGSGQLNATTTITAGTGITSTTGNIVATAGQVNAGTTMTAGTGITSTTGNIVATAGQVNAGTTITAGTGITSTTGAINATGGTIQTNSVDRILNNGTVVATGIRATYGNPAAGAYAIAATDYFLNITNATAPTLPSANPSGRVIVIHNISGANINVAPNGADKIDGVAAATIVGNGITRTFISDGGTNWYTY
ncbi:MAG TPA: hypothetical protein VEW28_07475 [Candidatus Kapabacteria bacterium]|nr:hypothetical protein [Candidatus Kapabacteria bacterium]